jgi:glutathione reductase (NADPH)
MRKKGVDVRAHANVGEIRKAGERFEVVLPAGETVQASLVMYATGRVPNTLGLGLENAGIRLDGRGAVAVDRFSRTNVDNIYAVGDVTDRVNLTPVAIREGAAFAETLFNDNPTAVDHSDVPTAVFSQPEIGTIGLTEAEARAAYPGVKVYKSSFRPMKHTLSGRDETMLMKLVVEEKSDRVLGCHILGAGAAEMIQLVGIAIKMGATKRDFDATMAVHPTAAEELVTLG